VDEASRRIWDVEIYNKPAALILDNWELVEGLMLCKEDNGIDNQLAAFSTVMMHERAVDDFVISERKFTAMAQNIKGEGLTEGEKKALGRLLEKAWKGYGERTMAPFTGGTPFRGVTLGLGKTIKGAKDMKEAVARLHRVHGWTATVEEGTDLPFERYKESIDKGIPILLEVDGRFLVGVGYVTLEGKAYLVIANLAEITFEKTGMLYTDEAHEYFQSLPPNDPERKMYEWKKSHEYLTGDYSVSSDKPLPPGTTIEEFDRGRYKATFVHGWRESAEAWRPEVEKIVGAKGRRRATSLGE
jgi:hypothetical protein